MTDGKWLPADFSHPEYLEKAEDLDSQLPLQESNVIIS